MYYVVGQHIAETEKGNVWDFQGVFDCPEKAEAAAKATGPNCFIGTCEMNAALPKETQTWPDAYYPSERG